MSPTQLPLFHIDDQFIFVFRSILTSGLLAKIKPNALAIHMTMKCLAFQSGPLKGCVDISIDRLVKHCNISETAVKSAIDTLVREKYLEILPSKVKNRAKVYRIFDLLPYESRDHEVSGILIAPYDPYDLRSQRQEILQFARTGTLKPDTSITNIVINGDIHFHIHIPDGNRIDATMENKDIDMSSMDRLRGTLGDFIVSKLLESPKDRGEP